MESSFFVWKKDNGKFRPVATKNFYVRTWIKSMFVKKGTIGGSFSSIFLLEEGGWAESSVNVCEGSHIRKNCYVCGNVEIFHTDISGCAYVYASGKIMNSTITSNSSIEHTNVCLVDCMLSDSRIGNALHKRSKQFASINHLKVDGAHLIGNFSIEKSEISGDVVINGIDTVPTEIKNSKISGDGSISGQVRILDSTLFLSDSNISDYVYIHDASARFVGSNVRKNAEITSSNISIFGSDILENARIGGNCLIENSIINSKDKLDFISTLPTNATVKLINVEILKNSDFTQFYIHENKVILVCRGRDTEMVIPTKNITENDYESACAVTSKVKSFLFEDASKEFSREKEWARWICSIASRFDLCEEAMKKYGKFCIATGLNADKKAFMVPLLMWSEISLASAILSSRNPGLGFATKDEIMKKASELSNHVFFDMKEKVAFVYDAPIVITLLALESIASEYGVDKSYIVDSLNAFGCIFADF